MTCIGYVREGKIELPEGVHLPDGAQVRIETVPPSKAAESTLADFIGIAEDMPPDMAINLDHYLYGHSKK